MSDYGVTNKGFVRKRYDTIYSELQDDISDGLGIDISINPKSFFNVLVASFADKIAAAWEVAEAVYFAHYPSTAEGVNLDYACQFGGVTRKTAAKTQYSILCTGIDGTTIPSGTTIASTTNPTVYFSNADDGTISRSACNKLTIKPTEATAETSYTIHLGGTAYTYLSGSDDGNIDILNGLAKSITADDYTVTVNETNVLLEIEGNNKYLNFEVELSDNLTTDTVSSINVFESEEYKKVKLSEGTITNIISVTSGFQSCTNLAIPVYGNEEETDADLRYSYAKKRLARSSTMIESITSAILNNVSDVSTAIGFENETDSGDNEGRPPHSIEIIVDGGEAAEIAQQILYYKAAGIQSYGNVVVDVPTSYGYTVPVKFNRPTPLYVWLKVDIVKNPSEVMPLNYKDLIKETIMSFVEDVSAGENIVIQKVISSINTAVSGIAYVSIKAYSTESSSATPSDKNNDYSQTYIALSAREKAYFSEDRIEVNVDED